MVKKYVLYLARWQASTLILWPCIEWFSGFPSWASAVIANLIGGLIFFWVDSLIFSGKMPYPIWTVRTGICDSCGGEGRLYRKIIDIGYDASKKEPVFLCEECSVDKDSNT